MSKRIECKRHRWRVGSGNAELINKKIRTTSLNIWCEKCGKKFKAYYHHKDWYKIEEMFKSRKELVKKELGK